MFPLLSFENERYYYAHDDYDDDYETHELVNKLQGQHQQHRTRTQQAIVAECKYEYVLLLLLLLQKCVHWHYVESEADKRQQRLRPPRLDRTRTRTPRDDSEPSCCLLLFSLLLSLLLLCLLLFWWSLSTVQQKESRYTGSRESRRVKVKRTFSLVDGKHAQSYTCLVSQAWTMGRRWKRNSSFLPYWYRTVRCTNASYSIKIVTAYLQEVSQTDLRLRLWQVVQGGLIWFFLTGHCIVYYIQRCKGKNVPVADYYMYLLYLRIQSSYLRILGILWYSITIWNIITIVCASCERQQAQHTYDSAQLFFVGIMACQNIRDHTLHIKQGWLTWS